MVSAPRTPPMPLGRHEARLLDRFRLLPPSTQASVLDLVQQLALPMDPRYRAFEQQLTQRNRARDRE